MSDVAAILWGLVSVAMRVLAILAEGTAFLGAALWLSRRDMDRDGSISLGQFAASAVGLSLTIAVVYAYVAMATERFP